MPKEVITVFDLFMDPILDKEVVERLGDCQLKIPLGEEIVQVDIHAIYSPLMPEYSEEYRGRYFQIGFLEGLMGMRSPYALCFDKEEKNFVIAFASGYIDALNDDFYFHPEGVVEMVYKITNSLEDLNQACYDQICPPITSYWDPKIGFIDLPRKEYVLKIQTPDGRPADIDCLLKRTTEEEKHREKQRIAAAAELEEKQDIIAEAERQKKQATALSREVSPVSVNQKQATIDENVQSIIDSTSNTQSDDDCNNGRNTKGEQIMEESRAFKNIAAENISVDQHSANHSVSPAGQKLVPDGMLVSKADLHLNVNANPYTSDRSSTLANADVIHSVANRSNIPLVESIAKGAPQGHESSHKVNHKAREPPIRQETRLFQRSQRPMKITGHNGTCEVCGSPVATGEATGEAARGFGRGLKGLLTLFHTKTTKGIRRKPS